MAGLFRLKGRTSGFTLIEVLFVLGILSVLVILSAPIHTSILDKQTEERFLKRLEMDILYTQSLAYNKRPHYQLSFPNNSHYVIKMNSGKPILERDIPEGWQIDTRILSSISFNQEGTIRDPGTISIETLSHSYNLTCPLGKGRCYVAKQ